MPDLGVYFDPKGSGDTAEIARRMERSLYAKGISLRTACRTDQHVAAVNVLKPFSYAPEQPFQPSEGDPWVMMEGALFGDAGGGMERLARCLDACDGKALLDINGQFNALKYFPREKRLNLLTDRLGSRPLYCFSEKGRHIIASEIKAVLAAAGRVPALDPLGVLELFAFGHNLGSRTVLEGVTVLPAGSFISVDENGLRPSPYFRYRYAPCPERKSAAELGEEIAAAVREAVPRYLEGSGKRALFLSGGLDSRIIAGAIDARRFPMHAFTFGYPEARDVRFAAAIAARMGFRHHVLTYPSVYLSGVIRGVVERTECAAPFHHATSILFHERIASVADCILAGFCGDAFSGGHLKAGMFGPSSERKLAGRIFRRACCAGRADLGGLFRPGIFDRIWSELEGTFQSTVTGIRDQSAPDTADVWDVENRQRRFTFSSPKVDRCRFEVLAPLLDNRIVDLVLTLPPRARRNQIAYKQAILGGFPELGDVPWTATGRPIPRNAFVDRAQETLRLSKRVLQKLRILRSGLGWRFRNLGEEMRRDGDLFEVHLMPFLEGGVFPEELLDREGVKKLVEDHRSGRRDGCHLLGTVLTLAVFMDLCSEWVKC